MNCRQYFPKVLDMYIKIAVITSHNPVCTFPKVLDMYIKIAVITSRNPVWLWSVLQNIFENTLNNDRISRLTQCMTHSFKNYWFVNADNQDDIHIDASQLLMVFKELS